jgi:hypothetical protein
MFSRRYFDQSALFLAMVLMPLGFVQATHAQTFDLEQNREQVTDLTGLWRFHSGDNPAWAEPGYNDSGWKLLRSDEPWSVQGYKGYGGMAWYRFQVTVPAQHLPLALYIPELLTSYQVYANGRMIWQFGGMPPHARALQPTRQLIPIPEGMPAAGQPLTLAIRVWQWPAWALYEGGGTHGGEGPIRIGDASVLATLDSLAFKDIFWENSATGVLLLIDALAGLAGVALFLLGPGEREYLWFGATELLAACILAGYLREVFLPVGITSNNLLQNCLALAERLTLLAFLFTLLRQRRGWVYWIAIGSALVGFVAAIPGELQWISMASWLTSAVVAYTPFYACVVILLAAGVRRGNTDARLLLLPFAVDYAAACVSALLYLAAVTRGTLPPWLNAVNARFNVLATWPMPFSAQNVPDFLMQLALLGVLLLRFARTRRDEQRLANELEAARAVQQVLVPEEIPEIVGYAIECVYKPAGEVGGDFFQVIGLPDGGVLAAIGDVSGKGMPAAMTVSLLVGALRTLAETAKSPAALLAGLNRRMAGRAAGGFTTCLVLRVEADGRCTAANAGHLIPYLNGKELSVENGLPLGLDAGTVYSETAFAVSEGAQLTLLTDGVVEARSKAGELFGFERAVAIAGGDAEAIAAAAQTFGQNDDITVLTLRREPAVDTAPARAPTAVPLPA